MDTTWIADLDWGLTIWQGMYEEAVAPWLRWCDQQGQLLSIGSELVNQEKQRADQLDRTSFKCLCSNGEGAAYASAQHH